MTYMPSLSCTVNVVVRIKQSSVDGCGSVILFAVLAPHHEASLLTFGSQLKRDQCNKDLRKKTCFDT